MPVIQSMSGQLTRTMVVVRYVEKVKAGSARVDCTTYPKTTQCVVTIADGSAIQPHGF